jgi:hypothetical protein
MTMNLTDSQESVHSHKFEDAESYDTGSEPEFSHGSCNCSKSSLYSAIMRVSFALFVFTRNVKASKEYQQDHTCLAERNKELPTEAATQVTEEDLSDQDDVNMSIREHKSVLNGAYGNTTRERTLRTLPTKLNIKPLREEQKSDNYARVDNHDIH